MIASMTENDGHPQYIFILESIIYVLCQIYQSFFFSSQVIQRKSLPPHFVFIFLHWNVQSTWNLMYGVGCGLVSCHNIVKFFHAFTVTSHLLKAYTHLCLFLNFSVFFNWPGPTKYCFYYCTWYFEKIFLLYSFKFIPPQELYPTPPECKWDLD